MLPTAMVAARVKVTLAVQFPLWSGMSVWSRKMGARVLAAAFSPSMYISLRRCPWPCRLVGVCYPATKGLRRAGGLPSTVNYLRNVRRAVKTSRGPLLGGKLRVIACWCKKRQTTTHKRCRMCRGSGRMAVVQEDLLAPQ